MALTDENLDPVRHHGLHGVSPFFVMPSPADRRAAEPSIRALKGACPIWPSADCFRGNLGIYNGYGLYGYSLYSYGLHSPAERGLFAQQSRCLPTAHSRGPEAQLDVRSDMSCRDFSGAVPSDARSAAAVGIRRRACPEEEKRSALAPRAAHALIGALKMAASGPSARSTCRSSMCSTTV